MSDIPEERELTEGEMVMVYHDETKVIMPGVIGSFHDLLTLVTPRGERYIHVYTNEGYRIERRL